MQPRSALAAALPPLLLAAAAASTGLAAAAPWPLGQPGVTRTAERANNLPNSPVGMPDGSPASVSACYAQCAAAAGCAAWSMSTCPPPPNSTAPPFACTLQWAAGPAALDAANCSVSGLVETELMGAAHLALPTGSVRPTGWLGRQLQLEADGLTGHLAEFYPDVANSSWIGGADDGSPQERAPYWLRGAVPLAHALGDARLLAEVQRYVDYALAHAGNESGVNLGWLGPPASGNRQYWGRYPMLIALQYHYEATRDERIPAAIVAHMAEQRRRMWTDPICGPTIDLCMWSSSRVHDLVTVIAWLIEETAAGAAAAPALWDFADMLWAQRGFFDWEAFFASREFPAGPVGNPYGNNSAPRLIVHGVDVAQAMKSGAAWWRFWGGPLLQGSLDRAAVVERAQGQPTGEVCGDEHLCGTDPSQATELCAIVELIASHAYTAGVAGDAAFYERAEKVAYNTLPAAYTKDMAAHPYLHQANEIQAVNVNPPPWLTDGGGANMYGIDAGHSDGCCTTNGGQGWPQALRAAVHATPDGGLALGLLAPVSAIVGLRNGAAAASAAALNAADGSAVIATGRRRRAPPPQLTGAIVSVNVSTDYPFDDTLSIAIADVPPGGLPLYLRIPSWVTSAATATVNGAAPAGVAASAGAFLSIALPAGASTVVLDTAPAIRISRAHNGSVVVSRGALIYSLLVGENITETGNPYPAWPAGMNYEIRPSSAWNYAIVIPDLARPDSAFNFSRRGPPGPQPFAGGNAAPVLLTAWARRVGAWGEVRNGAAPPPASPVCGIASDLCGEPELVTLVPHGSTLLRMTAMPYAAS